MRGQVLEVGREAGEFAVVFGAVPVHGHDRVVQREDNVLRLVVQDQRLLLVQVLHRGQILDAPLLLRNAAVVPVQHELYVRLERVEDVDKFGYYFLLP